MVCPQSQQSDNCALTSVSTVTPVLGFNGQHHSARQHPSFIRALEWGKTLGERHTTRHRYNSSAPLSVHLPSKQTSGGPQGLMLNEPLSPSLGSGAGPGTNASFQRTSRGHSQSHKRHSTCHTNDRIPCDPWRTITCIMQAKCSQQSRDLPSLLTPCK